jgi:hypothetical protein
MAMLRAGSVDVIEIGGEYVEELKKVGVRTLTMPNLAWLWVILGGSGPPSLPMTPMRKKRTTYVGTALLTTSRVVGHRDRDVRRGCLQWRR